MSFSHQCIKPTCGQQYQDDDIDDFYCPDCNKEKKALATLLDKKFRTAGIKVVSELQAFEATAKTITAPNGRSITFGRA